MKIGQYCIEEAIGGKVWGKGPEGLAFVEIEGKSPERQEIELKALQGFDTLEDAEEAAEPLMEEGRPLLIASVFRQWDEATTYLMSRKQLTDAYGKRANRRKAKKATRQEKAGKPKAEAYTEKLKGTLAAGIRQERLIAAALAEETYKKIGILPEPPSKANLIEHAEATAEKTIAENLKTGEIDQEEAKEARRAIGEWIAELRKAPDEIAKRQREAIEKSLKAQGLEYPKEGLGASMNTNEEPSKEGE